MFELLNVSEIIFDSANFVIAKYLLDKFDLIKQEIKLRDVGVFVVADAVFVLFLKPYSNYNLIGSAQLNFMLMKYLMLMGVLAGVDYAMGDQSRIWDNAIAVGTSSVVSIGANMILSRLNAPTPTNATTPMPTASK